MLATFRKCDSSEELSQHYQAEVVDDISADQMNHQLKMQKRFTRIGEMTRQETRNTANQSIKNFGVKSDQTSQIKEMGKLRGMHQLTVLISCFDNVK